MDDEPEYAWRYRAKCLGVVPSRAKGEEEDIFYPPRNKDLYKTVADKAKAVCLGHDGEPPCVIRKDCLWFAIETDEPHGIWGGMSHRERNALVRKWRAEYSDRISLKDFIYEGPPLDDEADGHP